LDYKDIHIRKSEFVAHTQLLYKLIVYFVESFATNNTKTKLFKASFTLTREENTSVAEFKEFERRFKFKPRFK